MAVASARVVSHTAERLIVDVDRREFCSRCASGQGCGAALLAGKPAITRLSLPPASSETQREPGETIEVELGERRLLALAGWVYALPLATASVAAVAAHALGLADLGTGLAAAGGLLCGAFIASRRLSACVTEFEPGIQ